MASTDTHPTQGWPSAALPIPLARQHGNHGDCQVNTPPSSLDDGAASTGERIRPGWNAMKRPAGPEWFSDPSVAVM
jgi:hypothetical protein